MNRDVTNFALPDVSVSASTNSIGGTTRSRTQESFDTSNKDDDKNDSLEGCRRKRMRLALEERLARRNIDHTTKTDTTKTKLQALLIEALLFKQSQSMNCVKEAADLSIDRQLKLFLSRVQLHRRLTGTAGQATVTAKSPAEYRTLALRNILGDELYVQTSTLIHQIQMVRHSLPSLRCLEQGGSMPDVARQLIFATPLVTAWHHLPTSQLETVSWVAYIQQAEQHLRQYHAWLNQSSR